MMPGSRLLQDDEQIFNSIGDEIVAVLQTSQDRKRLSEMQSAQVAMAERRIVSSFVHDQLGQNLGYMHLKLDQLSSSDEVKRLKSMRAELEKLREVANESYEIVRDILKKIQPETIPHLTNLLHEHAKTVSRRAKFELSFKSIGKPVHLPTNPQQLVFFTFREILSNIEKHAKANKVDVLVTWNENFLDISVADNGQGFDPDKVDNDEHFGMEIMKERIANIKGQLSINSSTGSGTVISISVPLATGKMVPA
jgi:signal transduction histidine kinase